MCCKFSRLKKISRRRWRPSCQFGHVLTSMGWVVQKKEVGGGAGLVSGLTGMYMYICKSGLSLQRGEKIWCPVTWVRQLPTTKKRQRTRNHCRLTANRRCPTRCLHFLPPHSPQKGDTLSLMPSPVHTKQREIAQGA